MKAEIPTEEAVRECVSLNEKKFWTDDDAVRMVFRQWPLNTVYAEVLVKVTVLNRLYSTSIFAVQKVARHITGINQIDALLDNHDGSLIDQISKVRIGGKQRVFYSFATKYCSWHRPDGFQIYDSYVDEAIWHYKKQFQFASFRRQDLRKYAEFTRVVDQFRSEFGLMGVNRKQLDKFLWVHGQRLCSPAS